MKNQIIDYFTDELRIHSETLKSFYDMPIQTETSDQAKSLREVEAIKLRDRINELNRHISIIKRMFPK